MEILLAYHSDAIYKTTSVTVSTFDQFKWPAVSRWQSFMSLTHSFPWIELHHAVLRTVMNLLQLPYKGMQFSLFYQNVTYGNEGVAVTFKKQMRIVEFDNTKLFQNSINNMKMLLKIWSWGQMQKYCQSILEALLLNSGQNILGFCQLCWSIAARWKVSNILEKSHRIRAP